MSLLYLNTLINLSTSPRWFLTVALSSSFRKIVNKTKGVEGSIMNSGNNWHKVDKTVLSQTKLYSLMSTFLSPLDRVLSTSAIFCWHSLQRCMTAGDNISPLDFCAASYKTNKQTNKKTSKQKVVRYKRVWRNSNKINNGKKKSFEERGRR